MAFWSLLEVASMPVVQFLLIGMLGAFLSSGYSNILSPSARKDINKVAFYVFSPSLVFSSLAKSVTLRDLISWWFMPVNIGIIFLIGGTLGWVAVKIMRPGRHLEGVIIGSCSAANLGNLVLILIPAICNESASPFGDATLCRSRGLSYVSLSMSLGNIYIWTHTYSLMRKSGALYNQMRDSVNSTETENLEVTGEAPVIKREGNVTCTGQEVLDHPELTSTDVAEGDDKVCNKDSEVNGEAHIIKIEDKESCNGQQSESTATNAGDGKTTSMISRSKILFQKKFKRLHKMLVEMFAPPTIAAIIGLIVGVTPCLKKTIIGASAPLRVIENTISTLGNALQPCTILILGGNLTQGVRKSTLKPSVVVVIILVRFVLLPVAGIGVVKAAAHLGILPKDPLFRYVLMIQFTLPPAMGIGTMAQLFDVAKEECSVIFLWTYLVAMVALTIWPTIFLSILS